MPWIKYQIRYGWGKGEVCWEEIEREEDAKYLMRNKRELEDDGHMFRGIDWSVVAIAPRWRVERELHYATEEFRCLEERIKRLDQDLLNAVDCTTCLVPPATIGEMVRNEQQCPDCGRIGVVFGQRANNVV